jgi:predicted RNA methylase
MSRRRNTRRVSDTGQGPRRHVRRSAGPARYYVQFPAGLSALVAASLESDIQAKIEFGDDSSAMFTSTTSVRAVAGLPFLKNVFHVLYDAPRRNLAAALDTFSTALAEGRLQIPREANGRSFRLMAHIDGRLAPLPKPERTRLEDTVSRTVRAQVEARGLGEEYWIVGRRDLDRFLLGRRRPKVTAKTRVPAGSLAPEVSDLLIRMSGPSKADRFLDPFGGSHALARARSRYPATSIITSDTTPSHDAGPGDLRRQIMVLCEDALRLPSIEDGSITAIVTDPPWGEQDPVDDRRTFLVAAFATFARVLTPHGSRVVILMNRRGVDLLLDAAQGAGFQDFLSYDILVNGHPATATLFRPEPY